MYNMTLTRALWFNSKTSDALCHVVATALLEKIRNNESEKIESHLWITRRYEQHALT